MVEPELDVSEPTDAAAPRQETAPAPAGPWMTGEELIVFTQANQER